MLSREAARRLIEEIRNERGYVSEEDFQSMTEDVRLRVKQALLTKDQRVGSAIVTLSKNLYSSNARFVFEMLQNCDDNHYTRARAAGEAPYVFFRMYADRIVVECNEDGFTEENVRAICDFDKSSKMGAQGYIGQKGIGFKSVFIAAYRVVIESGNLSFYLQHRRGDIGIDMITPVWQPETALNKPRPGITRFTLYLHGDGASNDRDKRGREFIYQQFNDIHDAVLLFMRNLERIDIILFGQDGNPQETSLSHTIDRNAGAVVAVRKTVRLGDDSNTEVMYYHTAKHLATDLSPSENRIYSEAEMQDGAFSRSEVVLAFPMSESAVPIVDAQSVFAFLPLRTMGFKFLIQADFVTEANRQDIVVTSTRNRDLLDGIAETFVKAVTQLCEHESLRLHWMRYLPQPRDYPWGKFWLQLLHKIKDRLVQAPIMQLENGATLQKLVDVRRSGHMHLAADGKYLLGHVPSNGYVSLRYQSEDLDYLKGYGIRDMSEQEFVELVRQDLVSSSSSIQSNQDEDWQSRLARVLLACFKRSPPDLRAQIKTLKLVPLRPEPQNNGEKWASTDSAPVYFPETEVMLHIPSDLRLKVATPTAAANADRRSLFEALGVQKASTEFVRNAVYKYFYRKWPTVMPNLIAYTMFLYVTHDESDSTFDYTKLGFCNHNRKWCHPDHSDLYIAGSDPYGPGQLLPRQDPGPASAQEIPSFKAMFLNDKYFSNPPSPPSGSDESWEDWLCRIFGIQRSVPLLAKNRKKLSDACRYIAKERPEKFMGYLRSAWEGENLSAEIDKKVILELFTIDVLCQDGMCPLKDALLPLKKWRRLCDRFLLPNEFFPWLKLEADVEFDEFPLEWEPLGLAFESGLGLGMSEVEFAITVLDRLRRSNPSADTLENPNRVYDLYLYLQTRLREGDQVESVGRNVREIFRRTDAPAAIYIPRGQEAGSDWASPDKCVWDSPIEMKTLYSLARLYRSSFPSFDRDRSTLEAFFVGVLGVPNCAWEDLVEEIRDFREFGLVDFNRISALYTSLAREELDKKDEIGLRAIFKEEPLICDFSAESATWHTTDQCIWSSSTKIDWMVSLEGLYGKDDLRDFFVKRLGIQKMTAEMIYTKLAGAPLSLEEAKQTLEAFSAFLSYSRPGEFKPEPVLEKKILPVRFPSGGVELRPATTDFAIADRQSLHQDFEKTAKFLDFDIDQVRRLQPFIAWAGLANRYISRAVIELSAADEAFADPVRSIRYDIRRKARALLSIAKAFESPRMQSDAEGFAKLLRNVQTFQTDVITSELQLVQDRRVLRVEKERTDLHIQEDDGRLIIFVPKNVVKRQVCFNEKLPRLLFTWMMDVRSVRLPALARTEAINAVNSVLNVDLKAQREMLEARGIELIDGAWDETADNDGPEEGKINGDEEEEEEEEATEASSGPGQAGLSSSSWSERTRSSRLTGSTAGSPFASSASSRTLVGSPRNRARTAAARRRLTFGSEVDEERAAAAAAAAVAAAEAQYRSILIRMVDAARQATFPRQGAYSTYEMYDNNTRPIRFPVYETADARNRKIGAAGELFVYELLLHLHPRLPGFSRSNWHSSIRRYANTHPDYAEIGSLSRPGMSDMSYNDTHRVLTDLLIDRGYLDARVWSSASLNYHIEIKTTLSGYETPFHLSSRQYERMQRQSNRNSRQPVTGDMNIIFRIFDLEKNALGLEVFVDPESLRLRGQLDFSPDGWQVVVRDEQL